MPNITLYRKDGSCSLAPHTLIRHLSIPFTEVRMAVDADGRYQPADGSLTSAQYRQTIHPAGYVPALVIHDASVTITELPAVLTYIASLAPERDLLGGSDAVRRAQVAEWLAWLSGTVHSLGFAAVWRPYRFADEGGAHDAIRAKGRAVVGGSFARIEERLGGREWAVGEAPTVVDFNLYVFRRWGEQVGGFEMARQFPSYDAVMRRLEGLDGVKKALEAEGLKPLFS
ncbi:glutathione S-transferase [Phialemonium atrogriseum]|uniref:Glutathione S-transferase n=1 Tax=Phialemonium atrogriseum TaxID=1093897 RepID=A0AAJ0BVT7_9PEZI|nr:glutathione S-transferase [Phialemonium atrogriseum]KAK1763011.1 glutathione S-transferase [Phialemonium atrogriseum]